MIQPVRAQHSLQRAQLQEILDSFHSARFDGAVLGKSSVPRLGQLPFVGINALWLLIEVSREHGLVELIASNVAAYVPEGMVELMERVRNEGKIKVKKSSNLSLVRIVQNVAGCYAVSVSCEWHCPGDSLKSPWPRTR